jgi:hypothetical protein
LAYTLEMRKLEKTIVEHVADLEAGTVTYIHRLGPLRHRHSSEGPAVYAIDWRRNSFVMEEYRCFGLRHREDGPAVTRWDPATKAVITREYRILGRLHRVGGPAVTRMDPATGIVIEELYARDGSLHRVGGPAVTRTDPATGIVVEESYVEEGLFHRVGGPARILRDPKTGRTGEYYYVHGQLHRDPREGEAIAIRDAAGAIVVRRFYRNGVEKFISHRPCRSAVRRDASEPRP